MRRRELLSGGLAAAAAAPVAKAAVPDVLATPEELQARTAALKGDPAVEVRLVGHSARGRPIELISLGQGPRNALVLGCPHPNEPAGCLTVEALIDRLRREPEAGSGFRWHFIKAIDPDGLDLNRAWLKGRRTPESYYRGFYRPAFDRQPEYTFPLKAGAHVFDSPTPENLAWQAALELTRPQLQVSLHHADYGGAFYCLSRPLPGLAEALARQPAEAGLTLNPVGEPFAEMAPFAPGVLAFPDIAAAARAGAWTAGDSSADYAAARYGTFSMINEVPLWDDARLRDEAPSGRSLADVIALATGWNAGIIAALSTHLPALGGGGADGEAFAAALGEALAGARRQNASLPKLAALPSMQKSLPVKTYALHATMLRLIALRPWALLRRLAEAVLIERPSDPAGRAAAAAAEARLHDGLAAVHTEAKLKVVPLRTLTGLQAKAVLTTARALA